MLKLIYIYEQSEKLSSYLLCLCKIMTQNLDEDLHIESELSTGKNCNCYLIFFIYILRQSVFWSYMYECNS